MRTLSVGYHGHGVGRKFEIYRGHHGQAPDRERTAFDFGEHHFHQNQKEREEFGFGINGFESGQKLVLRFWKKIDGGCYSCG